MITFVQGNILTADVEAIVNPVNCVGVMGRGLARQFKEAWPNNFKFYKKACDNQQVIPGQMCVFETNRPMNPRYIINFPTKRHWRMPSRMDDIEKGFIDLVRVINARHIQSIAIPAIGAGLGGLPWDQVKSKLILATSKLTKVNVVIYEPVTASTATAPVTQGPACPMTPGRAALIVLMQDYLNGLLDPTISQLEIHQLLYLIQAAGEPLHLRFEPKAFGLYASNLHGVLRQLEGHYIEGWLENPVAFTVPIKLKPDAVRVAKALLDRYPETLGRCQRVARLISGFESTYGTTLLATVHWVSLHQTFTDEASFIASVQRHHADTRTFEASHILLAKNTLVEHGW